MVVKRIPFATAAIVVLFAADARAWTPAFVVGLRSGSEFGFGKASPENQLGDRVRFALPAEMGFDYRINRHVWIGAYYAYAWAAAESSARASYEAKQWRYGVEVQLHSNPHPTLDLWCGGAVGPYASGVRFDRDLRSGERHWHLWMKVGAAAAILRRLEAAFPNP